MLSSGIFTALITPMDALGQCDWETWEKLIAQQKAAGVQGIVVHGTTGEGATLTTREKQQLLSLAVQHQAPDFKIIAGVGAPSTAITCEQAEQAINLGVDALMVVTPYYNCPTLAGLKQHYQAMDAFSVPYLVYHVPKRTGLTLLPEDLISLLRDLKYAAGVKAATGDASYLSECLALLSEEERLKWQWYAGDDPIFGDYLKAGATGAISVTTNAFPEAFLRVWQWAQSKQWEKVSDWQASFTMFQKALFSAPNPIMIKALLAHRKQIPSSALRLPLLALPNEASELTHLLKTADTLRIMS